LIFVYKDGYDIGSERVGGGNARDEEAEKNAYDNEEADVEIVKRYTWLLLHYGSIYALLSDVLIELEFFLAFG
jgi:hypothetical protein